MTWPTGNLPTTHFDSGTDDPNLAKDVLKQLIEQFNELVAHPSTDAKALLAAANYAAMRTLLSLVPGTHVQAFSQKLQAFAQLSAQADRLPYFTGADTLALATLTAFARSLLAAADAGTARGTLGLGNMALQSNNSVNITGGSINVPTLKKNGVDVATTSDTSTLASQTGNNSFTGNNTFTGDNRIKDTLVLYDPDDDTKGVMIDAGSVSSGQTRVITMGDADFNLRAATQAEQEAIVDNDVIVTPANQHSNPSAVKAWAHVMYSSGVPSLIRGYNIAGLVDVGTGVITVLWDVDFSDGDYVPGGIAQRAQNNASINTCINGSTSDDQILPGSTTYRMYGTDGTLLDPLIFTAQASGDQVGP